MTDTALTEEFKDKATLVSARVYQVNSLEAAFDKAVEICRKKAPLDPQMGPGTSGENRIMAAPNLDDAAFGKLSAACGDAGDISLIRENLRDYPGGIDMGVSLADYGIAETGTLVLDSRSEETRLSTMLSEIHVAVLETSKIRETALAMTEELTGMVGDPGSYMAFITGASRTADIERVLAIGAHGPLELHIMLVEE
ncbi:MAG: lactate utilization protein [Desulfobacterales bacterium]|nr:lactate utilization protein [Desulfobacterales bacterium]